MAFFPKHGFLSGLVTPACGSGQGAPPVSIEAVCVVVWRAVWGSVEQCGSVESSVEQWSSGAGRFLPPTCTADELTQLQPPLPTPCLLTDEGF